MGLGAVLVLAVGLAMDATAVAVARGAAASRVSMRDALAVALMFGGAQAAMPLLGWVVGSRLGASVAGWDHWIAFGLLIAVGGRMLWQARGKIGDTPIRPDDVFGMRVLLVLAFATSVDAFAVGITLPMLRAPMLVSVTAIGVVTAVLGGLGVAVGRRLGQRMGHRLDALGGLVLVALAVKILIQHLLVD